MKKIIAITISAIAALILTGSIVKATVVPSEVEIIEFTSKAYPSLNCKMSMDKAESIIRLLPEEIMENVTREYNKVSSLCKNKKDFKYQGVKVLCEGKPDNLSISFNYSGYGISVSGTSWDHLDQIFQR